MRVTKSVSAIKEMRDEVFNHSVQILHNLTQFGLGITRLESMAAEFAERARTFVPAPPPRDGLKITDPRADESDPREVLEILRGRLRQADENYARAAELLEQLRDAIRRIQG
jgi:hypothetical protein